MSGPETDGTKPSPRDAWIARMSTATPSEKNHALAFAIDTLSLDQVTLLLDSGMDTSDVTTGIPLLAWAIRRTDDWDTANLLLDRGFTAKGTNFKDLWAFIDEDRPRAYALLERLVDAGMTLEERARAAIFMAANGDAAAVERRLLKPGEDLVSLLDEGRAEDTQNSLAAITASNDGIAALYNAHFASGLTVQKFKEAVDANGMTGLQLAVRAGKFDVAVEFFSGEKLDAADLTREDKFSQSVISLLGHRQQLSAAFAPQLWHSQPEAAFTALEAVPERYKPQLDQVKITRDIAQLRLARRPKITLTPPKA